jgi:hypothetical protein
MNLFFWSGLLWEKTDEMMVSKLSFNTSKASEIRSSIAVIDVDILQNNPPDNTSCISCQRELIVNLLKTINAEQQKPEALILDFSFSSDTTLIKDLKTQIEALQQADVKVYASYDIDEYLAAPEDQKEFFTFDIRQAQELYDLLGNRLHTNYTLTYKPEDQRFLIEHESVKYLNNLKIDGSIDSVAIESVIHRVNLDQTDADAKVTYENKLVPLGNQKTIEAKTYRYIPGKDNALGMFEAHPSNTEDKLDFKKKDFIIVGDLTNDIISAKQNSSVYFPGPYLVAWTLSEELANADQKIIKQYESSLVIISIQTIAFSLFTVLIFALLFKYVKRLQTKPWALALLSILISIGVLALYVLLFISLNKIPLISLTVIGILLASILAWRFAYKFLVTGIAEGASDIDLFISYSHGDSTWVRENVYEPLKDFKVNGRPLKIFYDVKTIKIGEAFTSKYMWGIVDSRLFVPIMSKEYYKKNHCKNEMDLAYKRYIEKLIDIMPIAFSFDFVPEIYQHVIVADITVEKDFIDTIKEKLIEIDNKKLKLKQETT